MEEPVLVLLRSFGHMLTAVACVVVVSQLVQGAAMAIFAGRVRRLETAFARLAHTIGEIAKDLVRLSERQRYLDREQTRAD